MKVLNISKYPCQECKQEASKSIQFKNFYYELCSDCFTKLYVEVFENVEADKETLANSLVIESNRANGLNKENENLKKEVAYLRKELKERGY